MSRYSSRGSENLPLIHNHGAERPCSLRRLARFRGIRRIPPASRKEPTANRQTGLRTQGRIITWHGLRRADGRYAIESATLRRASGSLFMTNREEFANALVAQIPSLRRYAIALAGNAALADDLVQDSIEKAL